MPYGWDTYDWRGEDDFAESKCWVCDVAHSVPSWRPLFTHEWYSIIPYHMMTCIDRLCEPTSRGWDWRIHNGYAYITVVFPAEEEVPEREKIFRQQMTPILDDPMGHWNRLKRMLMERYERLIPMKPEEMRDCDLADHIWDLHELDRTMWYVHFTGMIGLAGGLRLFREMLLDLLGIRHSDVKYAQVMSGFDNALFALNKGVATLATKAVELKVEQNLKLADEEVIPAMEQTDAGRNWVQAFYEFLNSGVTPSADRFGLRGSKMLDFTSPTWMEKPSLAVAEVKRGLAAGGIHAPELQRERLVKVREEVEKELLAKVPAEQRGWFEKLMRCAQMSASYYSEDHDYWCEFQTYGLRRRAFIEFGRRIAKKGVLDHPEDINFLRFDHVRWAAINYEKIGPRYLRNIAGLNKKEWEYYIDVSPVMRPDLTPPFLGDPAGLADCSASDTLFNVVATPPVATPEEVGALCVGCIGAPGAVEGVARVVLSPAEWGEVRPGEILVTPFTDATWTPLFAMIKGAVVDGGGLLAHASIVGREYGIPAVVGTMDACRKIKTGDKIRVDGNLLRVYVIG